MGGSSMSIRKQSEICSCGQTWIPLDVQGWSLRVLADFLYSGRAFFSTDEIKEDLDVLLSRNIQVQYSTVLNNRLVVLIVLQGVFFKVVLVIIVP